MSSFDTRTHATQKRSRLRMFQPQWPPWDCISHKDQNNGFEGPQYPSHAATGNFNCLW